jgi:EmrB/QacA subfamily drug resistance transporter
VERSNDLSVRRAALIVASISSFLAPFLGSSVNIALPRIGEEFAMSATLLGWVTTSYLLAAAMFLVPMGKLADIHGRKRVFVYGTSVYTLASLLAAVSPSAPLLIGARVLQGVGSAMIFGTGVAILTSVYPPGERGRALGFNVTATYTGLSLGPFLGGVLTENFGWRSLFLVHVPVGILILAVVFWKLKREWKGAEGEQFDLIGSLIYGLSLIGLMYGLSLLPNPWGLALILPGVLGLGFFAWWETQAKHPVLNVELFLRNTVFAFSNLAALINYSATHSVSFLLSLYLQHLKDLGPQQAGLVLVSQPIMMALFSPFTGRLSDRIAPRIIASIGMVLTGTAFVMLSFVQAATPILYIVASQIVLGLGFALFSSPNMNAIMGAVERRLYGVASATAGTMRLLGQMLSMGVAMLLFALYLGDVEIGPAYYPQFLASVRVAFAISAGLCFAGVLASLARGRGSKEKNRAR